MGLAGAPSESASKTRGPVPCTVEIESQYEVGASAAVPGTAMGIEMRRVAISGSAIEASARRKEVVGPNERLFCGAAVSAAKS